MKTVISLLVTLVFSTSIFANDCEEKVNQTKPFDFEKVELFKDVELFLSEEKVDWTDRGQYKGNKVIVKLHTKIKETDTSSPESRYKTKYILGDLDLYTGIGSSGLETVKVKFTAISEQEALQLSKGDGIKIVNKIVDKATFTLKRDIQVGQKVMASFEVFRAKSTIGIALTNKTSLEFQGGVGTGFSYTQSVDSSYDPVSNFYLGVEAGVRLRHSKYGSFGLLYQVDSGVVIQNVRPGSPVDTSREGLVKANFEVAFKNNTKCEAYIQKKSYQINPGFNEQTGLIGDRLYEKAKQMGVGCQHRF